MNFITVSEVHELGMTWVQAESSCGPDWFHRWSFGVLFKAHWQLALFSSLWSWRRGLNSSRLPAFVWCILKCVTGVPASSRSGGGGLCWWASLDWLILLIRSGHRRWGEITWSLICSCWHAPPVARTWVWPNEHKLQGLCVNFRELWRVLTFLLLLVEWGWSPVKFKCG